MTIYGNDITTEVQKLLPFTILHCKIYQHPYNKLITFVDEGWCVISVKVGDGYNLTFHDGENTEVRLNGNHIASVKYTQEYFAFKEDSNIFHDLLVNGLDFSVDERST